MHVKSISESAILTIAMRWSDRLIGLASTIVLARLLVPADFGVIVMASVVAGLVDVLIDLGVSVALIHNNKADRDDFNTAWTIRLIQSCLAGIIIYFSAPIAADYYNNLLVIDVLHVMALSVVIAGFENIGVITFQKNMEFGKDFKFFFYKRFSGFVITMIAAFLLQSYWAMVIGALAGRIIGVLLSYQMHPHRPQIKFTNFSGIWSISKWVLLGNIGRYLDNHTDKILIGSRTDAGMLGVYSVAKDISAMPTTEILAPLGRVLFPTFVLKRDQPEIFVRSISLAVGVQALFAVPACIGLALVANDATLVLLGPNWLQAVPFIQIMAFTNLLIALAHSGGYALLATGAVKLLAIVTWLQAIFFLGAAILLFPTSEPIEIAEIRVLVVAIGSVILIGITLTQIKALKMNAYLLPMCRPLIASGGMALLLIQSHAELMNLSPIIRLAIEVVMGCLIYIIGIALLWVIQGRPKGAEEYLFKIILEKFRRTERYGEQ